MKYKITINGYGSEITIGSVNSEIKEMLSNKEKELNDIIWEDLEEVQSWSETDDQFHCFGATNPFTLTVEDENDEVVFEVNDDDIYDYNSDDLEFVELISPDIDDSQDLLVCWTGEKGCMFYYELELEGEFDHKKLKIVKSDIDFGDFYFGEIVSEILYDGEILYNEGGDTNNKSFEAYINF